MRLVRIAVVAALVSLSVIAGFSNEVSAYGSQSCVAGDTCVSYYAAGSRFNGYLLSNMPTFGLTSFVLADGSLVPVANNTGYGRIRNSSYARACFYTGTNFTGTGTPVPYSGATWVLISQSTESYKDTNNALC